MTHVYVLAEHRKQQLRDSTWEAVEAGRKLAADLGGDLTCVLLAAGGDAMAAELAKECPKVLTVDDPKFEKFNSDIAIKALTAILQDKAPFVLVMANSNSIMDLAPGLSVGSGCSSGHRLLCL